MNTSTQSINLLPKEQRTVRERVHRFRLIGLSLFILLVGIGIVAVAIWAMSVTTSKQLSTVEIRIGELQRRVASKSREEQQYQLLANRLNSASTVLTQRSPLDQYIDEVTTHLPEEIVLRSIEVQEGSKTAKLTLVSTTYATFSSLFNQLKSGVFPLVTVDSLGRDAKGTYVLSLRISVK